ncbi:MAG: hypothetical protein A2268_01105 [Candidatus Raymondbacteria bacterium RifOxyA12_full_50_37]|uniref:SbsA Ig-like domain-containing protein n=1 Tax=Candidatus Raymondbacteria bacterium RIFOXYD12_FULL_49_13 TaxID=1817890 RepID=A0A1F7FG15_UNCRA|nr:MAG: hypothetical protein A2268_01105 [Candidatus Raymondbacteria bacterium RifOxyA12_full_50_37]OGJ86401.1 MAG: hypothetical protein A2248_14070 [Candidatus Raymondbacteria bacterium RIFOXYA2_FULL_49_16]OGJ95520.1 MAG: hypothetical protein A2350_11030 [Candidatus Raymondbacteria bacterium RifOxyB12_full_50_8]OGJ95571.1 MAG: hypothetical protein A2453_12845 [Candidatus Raymondbacteria bacterium RIFOXYC2_FULL_50_21]OGK05531.1 MAG: hypothetical protein A2519_05430 [Candidatus Raymondbacteria b
MEDARPFKIRIAGFLLCLVFLLIMVQACTVNVDEPAMLSIESSYPARGQEHVRVFGPYYFVFNRTLGPAAGYTVAASFNAGISVSNETLSVTPDNTLLDFATPYTITISRVADAEGNYQDMDARFPFVTAAGEQEDNDEPGIADTLATGDIVHGQIGKEGNAPVDNDYFIIQRDSTDSVLITVTPLTSFPVICVLPDTAFILETNESAVCPPRATPFTVLITNRYLINGVEKSFGREGWYSIRVDR